MATPEHEKDVALVGERLLAEATERNWCIEFDCMLDDLNEALTVRLPTRRKPFKVRAVFTVAMTTEVEAISDADALNKAREALQWRQVQQPDGQPAGWERHNTWRMLQRYGWHIKPTADLITNDNFTIVEEDE